MVKILADGGQFEDVRELVAGTRGRRVYDEGDPEAGVWSVGMVQGLIHDIPTCAELIDTMITEAAAIVRSRLAGMLDPVGVPA